MISSKIYILQVIIFLYVICAQIRASETAGAKTGSCLHKISGDFLRCNSKQQEKINSQSTKYHSYTPEEKQLALNKITCCTYWEFLECVKIAVRNKCNDEIRDIEKHIETLGISVPIYICRDEYPKGSFKCKFPIWLILLIIVAVVVILTFAVFIFICIRNSR